MAHGGAEAQARLLFTLPPVLYLFGLGCPTLGLCHWQDHEIEKAAGQSFVAYNARCAAQMSMRAPEYSTAAVPA